MKQEKSFLSEVASDTESIKTSRSEPLEQPRQSMDFIRSLMLDIPVQNYKDTGVDTNMNIEKIIETQLEAEIKKIEQPADKVDMITLDVPLFLRLLEYAKEDAKTDMDLHHVTEKLVALSKENDSLSMKHYGNIVQQTDNVSKDSPYAGDQQTESLTALQKLAGIK